MTTHWHAIGDYGLIGDCRIAALVNRNGSIDWLCLPHYAGPAFFAAILDRSKGGRFSVKPAVPYQIERHYVGNSNVLQTTFKVDGGELRLTDAICIPGLLEGQQLQPQRELLREIEAVGTGIPVEVVYEPRPNYGRANANLITLGKLGWRCAWRDHLLLLQSDLPLGLATDGTSIGAEVRLSPGERHFLSATYVRNDIGVILPLGSAAAARIDATARWWQRWLGLCTYEGPYSGPVRRSALVLKLMTFSLSGAVIAAPTTSLPEVIGGVRNWDYRYCWLRDASLTLEAFNGLGFESEGAAFLNWLLHATRLTWPRLQVLYDVYGEARINEETLDHLEGYHGSRPVRIGNGAWDQLQLDVYGSVIMAAAMHVSRGGQLGRGERRLLVGLGRRVCQVWRYTDHGIWEIRGERRQHTYSKVTCWAALDCLIELAKQGVLSAPADDFRRERDAIRAAIEEQGYSRVCSSYTAAFDSVEPDASLLLLPRYRYCKANDPRMVSTFAFVDSELGVGPLLYRYRANCDGLEGKESTFAACSFWAVDYLARVGRVAEARDRFERLLDYANDLGLYGEEIDAETGAAVGNFPQAFTHIGLINAALSLAEAERRDDGNRRSSA
ncbi:glycoside hydrolase family 15 protein [Bradyrhizobium sp. DN5]|uniref:glycoside hydrolase family 15 protein n=1 Tax=Bradyrhizobium sp. DN5 TaxID=3056950 RepID=UPI003523E9A7